MAIKHVKNNTAGQPGRDTGQAMIEFMVGLVAVLVITAALLQISSWGLAHTRTLIDAREEAGDYALRDQHVIPVPGPLYILDWKEGDDGQRYSRDDEALSGDPTPITTDILTHARPDDIDDYVPDNPISTLNGAVSTVDEFGLVVGREEELFLPVLPIIRKLLYDADTIDVEAEVWMTWTKGIY